MNQLRFAICLLLITSASNLFAQERRQAANARFDLMASSGRLDYGIVAQGTGSVNRPSWLGEPKRSSGYTIEFPVTHFADTTLIFDFIPQSSGRVELKLLGPWAEPMARQEISWRAVDVKGATMTGRFGQVTTWHDDPRVLKLEVRKDKPVTLTVTARAIRPPGTPDMQRLPRNTPATRARKRYRRGVNLGNFLEAPRGADWGVKVNRGDFVAMKREGFDHVRVPVRWSDYCGRGPEHRIDETFAKRVDQVLAWCNEQSLSAILNVHHFDDFTSRPDANLPQLRAIWRQVARRYANQPETVAFEFLNEPRDAATTTVMNGVYKSLIADLRRTQPRRIVFVGPGDYNKIAQLGEMQLPDDDRVIVTVHCYEPFLFTHQGADWTDGKSKLTGIQFPGPPSSPLTAGNVRVEDWVPSWLNKYNKLPSKENPVSRIAFADKLRTARQWSEYYGRPIHIGEFGAYTKADAKSRANYYRAFREECDKQGLGWAIWDWSAGFRYWNPDRRQPAPGMRDALFNK